MSSFRFGANLRLVVLDCPIDSWKSAETAQYFHRIINLKLAGYGKEYSRGALAIDTTDFIGTHYLVECESQKGWEPVLGFKAISLARAEEFYQPFTPLALVKSARAFQHIRYLNKEIEKFKSNPSLISYSGSLTVNPHLRSIHPGLTKEFKRIVPAIMYHYHQLLGINESIVCTVLRFKMDQVIPEWGYEPLQKEGVELPTIRQVSLGQEEVQMFRLKQFTDFTKACASEFSYLWENRKEILPEKEIPIISQEAY